MYEVIACPFYRVKLPARSAPRGTYRVKIAVRRGKRTTRGTITGRRL